MSEVKVSVVMPVYNASRYLEETLGYVLNQTLREIELICVDDGSTDDSLDILKRYKEQDKRLVIVCQKNQYAGVARNNGLAVANGKYVIFWDADDIFREDALEKLYQKAEEDSAQITICAANKYDEAYDVKILTNTYLVKDRLPENVPFERKEIDKYLFTFAANVPWNKLYLRSFVLEHKLQFENRKQANDAYFVMMSLFYAKKFSVVDEALIDYRIGTESSTTDRVSDTPLCACEAYETVWNELKKLGGYDGDIEQSFVNKILNSTMYILSIQNTYDAFKIVFDYLKNTLYVELQMEHKNEDYFYNLNNYADYKMIIDCCAEEFLVYKMKMMSEDTRRKNSRIRELRERRNALIEQRNSLKEERAQLKKELAECKKVNKQQKKILDSRTVRYALKLKRILTLNGRLKKKSK